LSTAYLYEYTIRYDTILSRLGSVAAAGYSFSRRQPNTAALGGRTFGKGLRHKLLNEQRCGWRHPPSSEI